ncbi:hypothetical protein BDN72DRAFT_731871, partial [Pluteus cervinus]
VSIQAAFVGPKWTLVFVDHNVMMTFHVMALRRTVTVQDFKVGSFLWNMMWSTTHGPSYFFEPEAAHTSLIAWRDKCLRDNNQKDCPIFVAVKSNQLVFNGYGAQETCDMLLEAFILPTMPASMVCADDAVWSRFSQAVSTY